MKNILNITAGRFAQKNQLYGRWSAVLCAGVLAAFLLAGCLKLGPSNPLAPDKPITVGTPSATPPVKHPNSTHVENPHKQFEKNKSSK